jgi:hypothetical protein
MKQFLCILLLAAVTAGCSDNQASVEEESKTTVNRKKPADELQSNTIEAGTNDVNVDTIGMAEFLALKAAEADENDISDDTTGFTAFKRSKAKTAPRPCDCEDSIKAKDNAATSDQAEIDEESTDTTKEREPIAIKQKVQ